MLTPGIFKGMRSEQGAERDERAQVRPSFFLGLVSTMNTLKMIIWLFPIAFMLHDFEEILFLEDWLEGHGRDLRQVLPGWAAG